MNRKRTTNDQTEAIDLSAVLNAKAVVPTPEAPVRRPRPSRRPSRRQPTQALSLRVPFDRLGGSSANARRNWICPAMP